MKKQRITTYISRIVCFLFVCIHIFALLEIGLANTHQPDTHQPQSVVLANPPWQTYPYKSLRTYPSINAQEREIDAEVYFVLDMKTGYVLAERNGRKQHAMASLTKLMTAYIIIEDIVRGRLSLEDTYSVDDISMFDILPYDASRMGLGLGQIVSIEELLKGLIVLSGNDASIMLAEISRGARELFIDEMNAQAIALGLEQTHFADTNGLSSNNVSTAEDIATLAYALLNESSFDITQYTSIRRMTWHGYTKNSTNRLLSSYDGMDGLKTGYISEAGFNFVGTANRLFLDGQERRVLAIVMGVRRESIFEGVKARANAVRILLDYAFDNFSMTEISYGDIALELYGAKGGNNNFRFSIEKKNILLPDIWIDDMYIEQSINQFIWAPLQAGEKVGQLNISYNDDGVSHTLTSLSVYAPQEVAKANIFKRLFHFIKMLYYKVFGL